MVSDKTIQTKLCHKYLHASLEKKKPNGFLALEKYDEKENKI